MYLDQKREGEVHVDYVGELLWKAADIIVEKGWCQGTASNKEGNVCAIGALTWATYELFGPGGLAEDCKYYLPAVNRLCMKINDSSIPCWNDAPGRTKQEVVAALRSA